jgi:predicted phage terminase large subunit-like protein
MRLDERAVVRAILRRNLAAFIERCFHTVSPGQRFLPNWHIEAIAYQLERVLRGEILRLIIALPPRCLKSICASVAFPAFILGHNPSARLIAVSYSQDLASKHARDSRLVMESPWYKQVFPGTRLDKRKNTEVEFETTARGYRLGTSVGGTLTGRGGDIIIIDDPTKPADAMSETKRATANECFDTTLLSRLDSKTDGAIVIVMQRQHVDDLVGHVLEKGTEWTVLNLPAIADEPQEIALGPDEVYRREIGDVLHPQREPLEALMEMKAVMGSAAFSAQYQQMPIPAGGALVRRDWFRTYTTPPDRNPSGSIVQSWDTASRANESNDFSVCTTWLVRDTTYFLLDVLRVRLEYPDLRRRIRSHAEEHGAELILIEDAGSGMHLIQDLTSEGHVYPIGIRPEGEKIVRLEAGSAIIEGGHVLIPTNAPWLDDFLAEILSFPNGRFDDQVDSLSQFLIWTRTRPGTIKMAFI